MKKLLAAFAIAGLTSTAVFAQAATDFATVDADASGDISITEANTVWPNLTAEAFAAADTDGDGKVSEAEYTAFLAANPPA